MGGVLGKERGGQPGPAKGVHGTVLLVMAKSNSLEDLTGVWCGLPPT